MNKCQLAVRNTVLFITLYLVLGSQILVGCTTTAIPANENWINLNQSPQSPDLFTITTSPPGANVSTTLSIPNQTEQNSPPSNNQTQYLSCDATPCSWALPQDANFAILIEKAGYDPQLHLIRNFENIRTQMQNSTTSTSTAVLAQSANIASTGAAVYGVSAGIAYGIVSPFYTLFGSTVPAISVIPAALPPITIGLSLLSAAQMSGAFDTDDNTKRFFPATVSSQLTKKSDDTSNNIRQYFYARREAMKFVPAEHSFETFFLPYCPSNLTEHKTPNICFQVTQPPDHSKFQWTQTKVKAPAKLNDGANSHAILFAQGQTQYPSLFFTCKAGQIIAGAALQALDFQALSNQSKPINSLVKIIIDNELVAVNKVHYYRKSGFLLFIDPFPISQHLFTAAKNNEDIRFVTMGSGIDFPAPKINSEIDGFIRNCG